MLLEFIAIGCYILGTGGGGELYNYATVSNILKVL